jgi:hypothetical protein
LLVCRPRTFENHARVDFIAYRNKAGDRLCGKKFGGPVEAASDDPGVQHALFGGQSGALRQCLPPQLLLA